MPAAARLGERGLTRFFLQLHCMEVWRFLKIKRPKPRTGSRLGLQTGHFLLLRQPWTVAHLGNSGHTTAKDAPGTDIGFWDGQRAARGLPSTMPGSLLSRATSILNF